MLLFVIYHLLAKCCIDCVIWLLLTTSCPLPVHWQLA